MLTPTYSRQSHTSEAAVVLFIAGIVSCRAASSSALLLTPSLWAAFHPMMLAAYASALAVMALLTLHRPVLAAFFAYAAVFVCGFFLARNDALLPGMWGIDALVPPALTDAMAAMRQELSAVYRLVGLEGDCYGVVNAMTLGDKSGISQALRQAYRVSGAAHVFALSGLHLSVVFIFLSCLLPRRRFPRASGAVLLALIWAYTVLVGCMASVMRAAVMLTVYTIVSFMRRRATGVAVLTTAAALLFAFMPSWVSDVGCQMSFMAVLGIAVFYRTVYHFVDRLRITPDSPYYYIGLDAPPPHRYRRRLLMALRWSVRWLWGIIALSLVAQTFVAPIVAYYFGTASPWFLLANIVVSPCTTMTIPLAFLLLALGLLSTAVPLLLPLVQAVAAVLTYIVGFQNDAIVWVASLPAFM